MPLQPTEPPTETPDKSKRAKWRKLETVADVRLAMATIIKRVYDCKLDYERGAVCLAGLRSLGKIIYDANIEGRLRALEDAQHGRELRLEAGERAEQ